MCRLLVSSTLAALLLLPLQALAQLPAEAVLESSASTSAAADAASTRSAVPGTEDGFEQGAVPTATSAAVDETPAASTRTTAPLAQGDAPAAHSDVPEAVAPDDRRARALARAERKAASRHEMRMTVPAFAIGYEYRLTDFLNLGARVRLLAGGSIHSSGDLLFGGDATALVRFAPVIEGNVGYSLHAGAAIGSYMWFPLIGYGLPKAHQADQVVAPLAGAEFIFGKRFHVGMEVIMLPVIPSETSERTLIVSFSLGRSWRL